MRKQPDDINIISSERSSISTSGLELRIPKRNLKQDEASPTQPSVAGPYAPQTTPILRKEERALQVSDTSDSYTSSMQKIKRQLNKRKKASDQQTQSIIQNIQKTQGNSIEIPISDTTFIGVASPRNLNERWSVDPNPNLPMECKW